LLLLRQNTRHHVSDHQHADVGRINASMMDGLLNSISR
jgi:hypothetical protein